MIPVPNKIAVDTAYAPLLKLCEGVYLTTHEVAKHYRFTVQHVHNMRRLGRGPAYLKLEGGAVRYKASEILAWGLYGYRGPITLERVSLALASMPGLKPEMRDKIDAHLAAVLGKGQVAERDNGRG